MSESSDRAARVRSGGRDDSRHGPLARRSGGTSRHGSKRPAPRCWPTSSCGSSGGDVPAEQAAARRRLHRLPERLLDEYRAVAATSQLNQILATARELAELVDRVVVLGHRRLVHGRPGTVRKLLPSVLQRTEPGRAGRPSADLLRRQQRRQRRHARAAAICWATSPTRDVDDRWGIVVISKSGGTLETAVAFRQFLAVLRRACVDDMELVADLVVPVTGNSGPAVRTGRERSAATRSFRFPTASAAGSRCSRRWACCRRRSWDSTSSSCWKARRR